MYYLFEKYTDKIYINNINIYDDYISIFLQIEIFKLILLKQPWIYLNLPSYLKKNPHIIKLLEDNKILYGGRYLFIQNKNLLKYISSKY